MAAPRARAVLLGLVLALSVGLSPAAASVTGLHGPHGLAGNGLAGDHVLELLRETARAERAQVQPGPPERPAFTLWPAPPPENGHLFARAPEAPRLELVVLVPAIASDVAESLPETRIRAFGLFEPISRPGSNRVSRENATGYAFSLWGNRVGPTQKGLWTDPVTGISYARARWYDARNASFLTEDPLQDIDSPNLYAFVGWQPNMKVDPLGLQDFEFRMNRKVEEEDERRREMERRRQEGPTISAAPEGSAARGAGVYAVDFVTFGMLSDEEAYYSPLAPGGGRYVYTSSALTLQSARDLEAFNDKFGVALTVVDAVAALRSPGKAAKFFGVALAAVAIFQNVDQPMMVPVEGEDGEIRMVRFEPKGTGSQFQDPESGLFIETPALYRRTLDQDLSTGTLDLSGDVEEMRRVQEFLAEAEASQGTTNALDQFVEVIRLVYKRIRKK